MTTAVAEQSAYVSLTLPDATVAGQTAYVGLFPGSRSAVTGQTAYLALFPPPGGLPRKRRMAVFMAVGG